MSQIRIKREALDEVERVLEQYREVLAELERTGGLAANTCGTYYDRAEKFVRWLKGDFDPGARNKP